MSFENDINLINRYAMPIQEAYLNKTHNMFRTVISFSSFRSRYGIPISRDAIEPTKALFERIEEGVRRKSPYKLWRKSNVFMIAFLGKPLYSINQRKFNFINNNFGNFMEAITIVPRNYGGELDVQKLFDSIEPSTENPVIVEKVHVKEIKGSMPTASDYIIRRFRESRFTHQDVIYLSSTARDE